MAKGRSTRRLMAVWWACLVSAVIGYAALVALGTPPTPQHPEAAAHWLARFAPIWLVLWLLAGAAVGGAAVVRQRRDVNPGRNNGSGTSSNGLDERHNCPSCGARLTLRRARSGAAKGQPQWVCPEHGPV